mmetsp:Transcript_18925/g.42042  ORF Transcript_18925/g.42042 Transcript_18925/m.42042 type:complete len:406 (+) Transcript_18925:28-1245(+)
MWEAPPLSALEKAVKSPNDTSIGMRMRAAYFLRQAYDNAVRNATTGDDDENDEDQNTTDNITNKVIDLLGLGLSDLRHGSLLRHEFAYVMGQLRDERCCPALERVLSNETDCVMVRHECGEALGAIAAPRSVSVLEMAIARNPNSPEIGETCQLALDHMKWKADGGDASGREEPMACACMLSPYSSVDPAPPHPDHATLSASEIGSILRNESLPLFERYRAMFSLRNKGGEDSVSELGKALTEDSSSALLRHEVAYVLGQMQHPASVESLAESLRRTEEHAMVRHESAEALGAIEGRWDDCEEILKEFLNDHDVAVRESCAVALDAADYWGHGTVTSVDDVDSVSDGGSGEGKSSSDFEQEVASRSFVQQKAITNGKVSVDVVLNSSIKQKKPNAALLNHFNVTS